MSLIKLGESGRQALRTTPRVRLVVVSQVTLWQTHPDAGGTGESTRVCKGFTGSSRPLSGPLTHIQREFRAWQVSGFPGHALDRGGGPLWAAARIAGFCRTRRCSGLFPKTDAKSSSPLSDKRQAAFGVSRGPRHGGRPPSVHEASPHPTPLGSQKVCGFRPAPEGTSCQPAGLSLCQASLANGTLRSAFAGFAPVNLHAPKQTLSPLQI